MSACSICAHPDRDAIDEALVSGESRRTTAQRFGVGVSSVQRHRDSHLSPALIQASQGREQARTLTLLERIENLVDTIEQVMESAKDEGKAPQILAAARELRAGLELLGKATGELKPDGIQVTFNVLTSTEWLRIQQTLGQALAPYPEAIGAVSTALLELGAGDE